MIPPPEASLLQGDLSALASTLGLSAASTPSTSTTTTTIAPAPPPGGGTLLTPGHIRHGKNG
jgi:hypothetical protein